ncbi:DUF397 domain-containing protein [Streptomyces hiroshimensis]|uniref:DUF397 domain-containing protein n=1 Tax=Streptomyces hiroshimensis TaxID=66424 RepID=A0ABQ2YI24_9ACTN|nr:DUF397 domain-containing protein [Streptomyces hiroshimensis]GGX84410.1 hypothetical protein GCM10010324_32500 [Streptomyces hiroshimensis]
MPDIWMKSSYSDAQHTCVEVAALTEGIGIRDSKDTSIPSLRVRPSAWTSFLHEVRSGRL